MRNINVAVKPYDIEKMTGKPFTMKPKGKESSNGITINLNIILTSKGQRN